MGRLNAAYLERKLRAAVSLVGGEQLQELRDVSSLITLESDRPEWGFAGGEQLFAFNADAAAGATLRYSALVNPARSGVIAVLEWAQRTLSANTDFWGYLPNMPGAGPFIAGQLTASTGIARDLRHANVSACQVSTGTNAASTIGNVFHVSAVLDSLNSSPRGPIMILPPGTAFMIEGAIAGNQVRYSFFWRERPLEGLFEIK